LFSVTSRLAISAIRAVLEIETIRLAFKRRGNYNEKIAKRYGITLGFKIRGDTKLELISTP
jgi:hypothetical protein